MSDLKTLLFSEEELKESQETPEVKDQNPEEEVHHDDVKPEESKAEPEKPADEPKEEKKDEAKPEEKTFDEEKEVKFRVKCAKSGEVLKEGSLRVDAKLSDAESQAKVIEHLGGLKKETVLEFFDEDDAEVMTFDDLYFSQEEIEASPKSEDEEKKPEEKEHDEVTPEGEKKDESKPEEKQPEEKEHDEVTPEGEKKDEFLKALAECRKKSSEGKSLSVAEKYFCNSMTKYFTPEEVKEAEAKIAPEVKEKVEDRKDLIERLNKENAPKDLLTLSKKHIKDVKIIK